MAIAELPTEDTWTEIDTAFDQQLAAFQRRRDGLVLSIEEGTVSRRKGRYSVVTLPQNFRDDNCVIDQVWTGDDRDRASEAAEEYMDDNPR